MRQSIFLLFGLIYSLVICAQSKESNAFFMRGIELYSQQRYKAAISEFKRSKMLDEIEMDSLDPRKEYTKEWIAHCYYKLSDIPNAEKEGTVDYDIIPVDRTLTTESDSIIYLAHRITSNGNIVYGITKLKEGLELKENKLGKKHYAVANIHALLSDMYAKNNDLEKENTELQFAKQIYQEQGLSNSYAYGRLLLREAYLNFRKES